MQQNEQNEQNELDTIVKAGSILLNKLINNLKTEAEIAKDAIFGGPVNDAANRAADAADKAEASPARQSVIFQKFVNELMRTLLKNQSTLMAMPDQKGAAMINEILQLIKKYEGEA
ncbi:MULTISPECIES: hypothetical protein [Acidithiobacillus]|uniref:Uncharacterized protein n=2 Tax=Acidithiobacillus thiooxidans TaxID=930 RepID=A0A1C2I804_ACITH|nr:MULTISPECIES: hypothetical protein [Acidithiobacillus]MDD2748976.1 hypothetical protein [Acidithiobacillus sp.]MDD5280207.1 hypothetical protein [Acidithiobacillus sp.]OCX72067.1 hypothetical protein A6M23_10450 [Acidithiobacillus thiooxidans]OCX80062.1 hypothetical protein A6P08_17060 [Acidithiobacillus thiooxidans]QFX95943.1 hypothetical protein GCD22_01641 [Acidithiobacillus thiooxidans ATCC 19377]